LTLTLVISIRILHAERTKILLLPHSSKYLELSSFIFLSINMSILPENGFTVLDEVVRVTPDFKQQVLFKSQLLVKFQHLMMIGGLQLNYFVFEYSLVQSVFILFLDLLLLF
jgi:hypothetical protein